MRSGEAGTPLRVLGTGEVFLRISGNAADPAFIPRSDGDRARVIWSGTLANDLFESHPANWMAAGRAAVAALIVRITEWAAEGPLYVQPHARHLVHDIPSALAFADALDAVPGAALAFAPWSLFEPSMMDDCSDHLDRLFTALAPRAGAYIVEDAAYSDDREALRPVPPGCGVLPAAQMRALARAHLPEGVHVLVAEGGDPSALFTAS